METSPSRRHYVIVVHGIGEQNLNETTTPVVHRFAEVRNPRKAEELNLLLPAYLSAQSVRGRGLGHRWSEFEGIPLNNKPPSHPFDGKPATQSGGENFRFVDLHWGHILQRHQKKYSSSTEEWAKALQARLQQAPPGLLPDWGRLLLDRLIKTALPAQKLLSWYNPEMAKQIFRDFLGDVHLYGDYARTRGKAVRHFHVVLDEIHIRDFIQWCRYGPGGMATYTPPAYTVIAHSLGSIMSFDALVYSRAKETLRESNSPVAHNSPSLPFPGYKDEAKGESEVRERIISDLNKKIKDDHPIKKKYLALKGQASPIPLLLWRDCIENFVTLGSPIDKYHVLWFQNYYHMGLKRRKKNPQKEPESPLESDQRKENGQNIWESIPEFDQEWSQDWLEKPAPDEKPLPKIVHYNLCDEQDPVGHHLDTAQATDNYKEVFDNDPVREHDVVFRRYSIPGMAHVKYWEDRELFKGIIKEVIEKSHRGYFAKKTFWEKDPSVYRTGQVWAYFRIPFITAVITFLLLTYGLSWFLLCQDDCKPELGHVVALVAAVLLWACPNPGKAYTKETSTDSKVKPKCLAWERIKPRRSIFAHLVAGAVEWRQVLKRLSQRNKGKSNEKIANEEDFEGGEFWKLGRKRYLAAALLVILPAIFLRWPPHHILTVALSWVPDSILAFILGLLDPFFTIILLFGLTYSSVMLYVLWVYSRTK